MYRRRSSAFCWAGSIVLAPYRTFWGGEFERCGDHPLAPRPRGSVYGVPHPWRGLVSSRYQGGLMGKAGPAHWLCASPAGFQPEVSPPLTGETQLARPRGDLAKTSCPSANLEGAHSAPAACAVAGPRVASVGRPVQSAVVLMSILSLKIPRDVDVSLFCRPAHRTLR